MKTCPRSTGDDARSLIGFSNLAGVMGKEVERGLPAERWRHDDQLIRAPAGSFRPNRFGLFDMHGKVRE